MNKKYMTFGLLSLLCIGLVSAGLIQYYGGTEATINPHQPIMVNGVTDILTGDSIGECITGETCIGSEILITNDRNVVRTLGISNDAVTGEVEVSYIGSLELTKKDANWVSTGEKIEINYTVVGDSIEVTGVPDDYTLIYYKDAFIELGERLENPQPVIIVTSDMGSLPQDGDANADMSADYCTNGEDNYKSCRGAKLWVVLTSDILEGNNLNWANMDDYYYETNLIQYSTTGEIIIYGNSDLTITPKYALNVTLNESPQVITTLINPIA